ncbi:MAG TPA: HAD hydrolase-like protein [Acidimicrobiales bacterium]
MDPLLILWDIDGTLIRGGEVAAAVFELALASVTGQMPRERVRMSGKTDPQIIAEYLEMMGVHDLDVLSAVLELAEQELAAAEVLLSEQGSICAGVSELLERLSTYEEVTQTLLTGNIAANALVKLRAFGLDKFIDFDIGAYGSDHAERTSLVPIALERAKRLRSLRIDRDRTWVIGDTPNDAACAFAGGVRCLLVATGTYSLDELRLQPADAILADLSDIAHVMSVIGAA